MAAKRKWMRTDAWIPKQPVRLTLKVAACMCGLTAVYVGTLGTVFEGPETGSMLFLFTIPASLPFLLLAFVIMGIILTKHAWLWILGWTVLTLCFILWMLHMIANPQLPRPEWFWTARHRWFLLLFFANLGYSIAGWIRWIKFGDRRDW